MKQLFTLVLFWLAVPLAQAQPTRSSPYDSARFTLFQPVPRQQLRELRPDRPGVTESPFTVDAGHFQLETDVVRLINRREAGQQEREWHAAYLTPKLGLTRRTDVQLELPLYSVSKERPVGESAWEEHKGFGDVTLRLKHNFLGDDQEQKIAMAAVGYVRLPTGGQAGKGAVEGGLILPVDYDVSDHWNLEVQLESAIEYDRDVDQHFLRITPAVGVDHEFTPKLSLLVEAFTSWNAIDADWQSSINIAPIYQVTNNLQVDFGVQQGLSSEIGRHYFLGFTVRR
jgi:hypothetical protein